MGWGGELALGEFLCVLCILAVYFYCNRRGAEGAEVWGWGGELALGEFLCALCVLAVLFFSVIAEVLGERAH